MPYIDVEARQRLIKHGPVTAGELTYVLYKACRVYITMGKDKYRFQQLAEVIGALICCMLEFYRRVIVNYEDKKIEEHGDVF